MHLFFSYWDQFSSISFLSFFTVYTKSHRVQQTDRQKFTTTIFTLAASYQSLDIVLLKRNPDSSRPDRLHATAELFLRTDGASAEAGDGQERATGKANSGRRLTEMRGTS